MKKSLQDKIVLITGASSGIGLACAEQCAAQGAKLLLVARRMDRLVRISEQLAFEHGVAVLPLTLDVCDRTAVSNFFSALPLSWQSIDILINNAGLALSLEKVQEGDEAEWERMIDTNIKGLLFITRQVLPHMLKQNSGHIVNLGSIAGYETYSGGSVYCATKFAVRALTQSIKMDVHGTPLRVTEIAPGLVETEFSEVRFAGDKNRAKNVYAGMTPLTADDIADAVLYCVTRPAHVNIQSLHINPTDQSGISLVHRRED